MTLRCVLIDDEPLALEVLKQFIQQVPELQLQGAFTDVIVAEKFLTANPVDLLFVDINMPDKKGTDLVRSLSVKPMVIFTTAYSTYAVEGFELNAVDYLVKPISQERFTKALRKALHLYQMERTAESEGGSLFVRSEYQLVKIAYADLLYIESVEDYLKLYTTNSKPVMTLLTMKAVLDKLPSTDFARIHRSYIVSLSKIKSIVNRRITLINGVILPISNSYIHLVKSWRR